MGFCVETDHENVPYIQLGDYRLRLDREELGEKEKERSRKELNETPENIRNGLAKMRELLKDEPDLYIPVDDDEFLLKYLRPSSFIPERAFKFLKRYYRFKIKYEKYGKNITPDVIRHVFDNNVIKMLPTRGPDYSRVSINRMANWDPKVVTLEDVFKAVIVTMEIAMLEPKTQLGGVNVILDMEGFSLSHFQLFSPQTAKIVAEWTQECIPLRLKGIHIVNQSYIFNMLFALFKPFLGEKLKKLIFFHGKNKKSLFEKVSPDCLPIFYGGTANIPEYPGNLFSEMLFYYTDYFEEYEHYGYNK